MGSVIELAVKHLHYVSELLADIVDLLSLCLFFEFLVVFVIEELRVTLKNESVDAKVIFFQCLT